MEKIASFTIDHLRLKRGVFLSRLDHFGDTYISTFDIRLKEPNKEPVVDGPALHALEHLGATYMRTNEKWKDRAVYWGPMGCRTGIYLILAGKYESKDVLDFVRELFKQMAEHSGAIPGATAAECGNYLDHNLPIAKYEAKKFLDEVLKNPGHENLNYPA